MIDEVVGIIRTGQLYRLCVCVHKIPYIIHNSYKTILIQMAPKQIEGYIHEFYRAVQNIQIPTTPSMVSKLYVTCIVYLI